MKRKRTHSIPSALPRHARGFSLIEMVLVIVITGIVFSVASRMLGEGFRAYFAAADIVEGDWQARLSLARLSRDLNTLRAAADITTLSPAQIVFTDRDGNSVDYTLAGTVLTRNGVPLADGIGGLNFTYTQVDAATPAAVNTEVAYVTVALQVTAGGANYALQTTVAPRNLW